MVLAPLSNQKVNLIDYQKAEEVRPVAAFVVNKLLFGDYCCNRSTFGRAYWPVTLVTLFERSSQQFFTFTS